MKRKWKNEWLIDWCWCVFVRMCCCSSLIGCATNWWMKRHRSRWRTPYVHNFSRMVRISAITIWAETKFPVAETSQIWIDETRVSEWLTLLYTRLDMCPAIHSFIRKSRKVTDLHGTACAIHVFIFINGSTSSIHSTSQRLTSDFQ